MDIRSALHLGLQQLQQSSADIALCLIWKRSSF